MIKKTLLLLTLVLSSTFLLNAQSKTDVAYILVKNHYNIDYIRKVPTTKGVIYYSEAQPYYSKEMFEYNSITLSLKYSDVNVIKPMTKYKDSYVVSYGVMDNGIIVLKIVVMYRPDINKIGVFISNFRK